MSRINEITASRRLAFGPADEMMCMAAIKYPWAVEIHDRMLANFWTEKVVAMGKDQQEYRNGTLSDKERSAYDKSLAFVSNLDGIQFNNIVNNIAQHVSAPEVSGVLARQAAEEYLHVRAYQTMIEAVALDPASIYLMFEQDGKLAEKNAFIMKGSRILKSDPTPANFARAVVANVILEGIHFYSAFLVFYTLARNGKMLASADMVKYINRDEGETHLDLFTSMHYTFKEENPELYDETFDEDARTLIRDAVDLECSWGEYIIDGGFLGLTPELVGQFCKYLGNQRSVSLGLGILYPNITDPVPWFESFSQPGGRKNFFERRNSEYQVAGLDW